MGKSKDLATGASYVDTAGDTMTGELVTDSIYLNNDVGQKLFMYRDSNVKYGLELQASDFRVFAEDQAAINLGHTARSDGSTFTSRLGIDSSGRVTKPYQPFFRAHRTSSLDITSQATIVYDATSRNTGNHYNTSNGRFTAPVAGVYSFGVYHWHKINVSGTVYLEFYMNGSTVVGEYRNTRGSSHNEYNRVGFHHEIYLNANDYITVRARGQSGGELHTSSGSGYSYFSGYLIG